MAVYKIKSNNRYLKDTETVNDISIDKIDKYLKDRLDEIDSMASRGDPWVFGACCTYIDMLALHVYYDYIFNGNPLPNTNQRRDPRCLRKTGNADFRRLCQEYLFPVNRKYQLRQRTMSPQEMDYMLYTVLRCGALHKFSMKTEPAPLGKAQPYSIVLGHRKNFEDNTDHHLECVQIDFNDGNPAKKSILLIAESFVNDLRACTARIIKGAKSAPAMPQSGQPTTDNLSFFVESFKNESPLGWFIFDDK